MSMIQVVLITIPLHQSIAFVQRNTFVERVIWRHLFLLDSLAAICFSIPGSLGLGSNQLVPLRVTIRKAEA